MIFAREMRTIQARDLPAFDRAHHAAGHNSITVRIDGQWREVFDVWADGDDPSAMFDASSEYTAEINKRLGFISQCWVGVRYVVEEKSTPDQIEDGLHWWRTCDLVQVQVPVTVTVPHVDPNMAALLRDLTPRAYDPEPADGETGSEHVVDLHGASIAVVPARDGLRIHINTDDVHPDYPAVRVEVDGFDAGTYREKHGRDPAA